MLALLLALTACTTPTPPATLAPGGIECPSERRQMCTREYRPVCATRDNGVRCITTPCPATEQKTYGNACSACADEAVLSYVPGACAEPG